MPLAADLANLALAPHTQVSTLLGSATTSWKTIVVRPGDTVWDIAIRHHTTTQALAAKNHLKTGGHMIFVGQRLLVPTAAPAGAPTKATSPASGTSPSKAPSKKPAASSTARGRSHVVRAGDTMIGIAHRYGVSLTKLLAANRLGGSEFIFVGQKVTIPGAWSSKPSTTPTKPTSPTKRSPTTTRPASSASAKSKNRLAGTSVPSRTQTAAMIRATALRHGVDPRLALAIGWQESGWNQRAVSYTNAVGVMQIMPISGIWASQLAGRALDLYDAQDNITAGVLILRSLQNSAESREQAIAAYYQGLYSVRTRGLYSDTRAYVSSILAIYDRM